MQVLSAASSDYWDLRQRHANMYIPKDLERVDRTWMTTCPAHARIPLVLEARVKIIDEVWRAANWGVCIMLGESSSEFMCLLIMYGVRSASMLIMRPGCDAFPNISAARAGKGRKRAARQRPRDRSD